MDPLQESRWAPASRRAKATAASKDGTLGEYLSNTGMSNFAIPAVPKRESSRLVSGEQTPVVGKQNVETPTRVASGKSAGNARANPYASNLATDSKSFMQAAAIAYRNSSSNGVQQENVPIPKGNALPVEHLPQTLRSSSLSMAAERQGTTTPKQETETTQAARAPTPVKPSSTDGTEKSEASGKTQPDTPENKLATLVKMEMMAVDKSKAYEKKFDDLNAQLAGLTARGRELDISKLEHRKALATAIEELNSVMQLSKQKEEDLEAAAREAKVLQEKHARLKSEADKLRERCAAVTDRKAKIEKTITPIDIELAQVGEEISQLKEDKAAVEDIQGKLNIRIQSLQKDLSALRQEVQDRADVKAKAEAAAAEAEVQAQDALASKMLAELKVSENTQAAEATVVQAPAATTSPAKVSEPIQAPGNSHVKTHGEVLPEHAATHLRSNISEVGRSDSAESSVSVNLGGNPDIVTASGATARADERTDEHHSHSTAIRRVHLRNLPSWGSVAVVAGLIWGGKAQEIRYNDGEPSAEVLFLRAEDCQRYFSAAANGIPFPGDEQRIIMLELHNSPEPEDELTRTLLARKHTRCLRVSPPGSELQFTPFRLGQYANGTHENGEQTYRIEAVLMGPTTVKKKAAVFRYTSIRDAVFSYSYLCKELKDHEIVFDDDPCDKRTGVDLKSISVRREKYLQKLAAARYHPRHD